MIMTSGLSNNFKDLVFVCGLFCRNQRRRFAIFREEQVKNWRREKKLELIAGANPDCNDPAESWFEEQISGFARFDNAREQAPYSGWDVSARKQSRCAGNDQLYTWIGKVLSL